jgi:hypothetical protein
MDSQDIVDTLVLITIIFSLNLGLGFLYGEKVIKPKIQSRNKEREKEGGKDKKWKDKDKKRNISHLDIGITVLRLSLKRTGQYCGLLMR